MASALSELKSAQALGNSWTGIKPAHSGILDSVGGATLMLEDIPSGYRTDDMISTLPSSQSGKSTSSGLDPNGVDWYAYNQSGPTALDYYALLGLDPTGSSASSQAAETPQPYAFMDTSLASMFGMDPATHYQEALSNTSYQRAVRDLQAAGLNPVLGISKGASVFQGTADPLAMMSGYGSSSGGSSYGSSGSGKSTANLSGIAKTLSYSAPYLVRGVVGLVTKNPYAAGLAQSATQTLVNLVKYN